MGCGMFLTRHPPVLSAAFNVSASYMPSHDVAADPYVTTAQWSRRFIGLRLFLSLGAGGWAAHARHVERATELARLFARRAEDLGWRVLNDPALAVVCLVPPPGSSEVPGDRQARPRLWRCLAVVRRLRGTPGCPRLRHAWGDDGSRHRQSDRAAGGRAMRNPVGRRRYVSNQSTLAAL